MNKENEIYKKWWIRSLKVLITVFFVLVNLIELIRPLTDWPDVVVILDEDQSAMLNDSNIWLKFGKMGGQFAFFTNWANWLFILTIIYGWMFGKYISPYWKNALSVYLLTTTIIFFALLSPFLTWGQSLWLDYTWIHEHFLVTCAWLVYFFSSKTVKMKSWQKSVLVTLSIPIIYFFFTLGIYIGYNYQVAVYPFLNFRNLLSLNWPLSISIIVSSIMLILIIWGFITINYLFFEINYYQTFKLKKLKKNQLERDQETNSFNQNLTEKIKLLDSESEQKDGTKLE